MRRLINLIPALTVLFFVFLIFASCGGRIYTDETSTQLSEPPDTVAVSIAPESSDMLVKNVLPETLSVTTIAVSDADAELKEHASADVIVLMYHHIAEEGNSSTTITPELFEQHLQTIQRAGYVTVSPAQMVDFVERGIKLPEQAICITFDDGYLSNYEYAYPLLCKYHMKATFFIIGANVGKRFYRDTQFSTIPHFDAEQTKELYESGLISIASHTYDMHQWQPYHAGRARENILRFPDESEEVYRQVLTEDYKKSCEQIFEITGDKNIAVAFPSGKHDVLSREILKELGVKITFGVEEGKNTLIKNDPESLSVLKRYNMHQGISTDDLLKILQ